MCESYVAIPGSDLSQTSNVSQRNHHYFRNSSTARKSSGRHLSEKRKFKISHPKASRNDFSFSLFCFNQINVTTLTTTQHFHFSYCITPCTMHSIGMPAKITIKWAEFCVGWAERVRRKFWRISEKCFNFYGFFTLLRSSLR